VLSPDRESVRVLSAGNRSSRQNWRQRVRPEPANRTRITPNARATAPSRKASTSSTGAKDVGFFFSRRRFSPRTGCLYIPRTTPPGTTRIEANYIAGTPYRGADVIMYRETRRLSGRAGADGTARHNRKAWGRQGRQVPIYRGRPRTGGDVASGRWTEVKGRWTREAARAVEVPRRVRQSSPTVTYLGRRQASTSPSNSGIGGATGRGRFPEVSSDAPYAATGRRSDEGHKADNGA